MKTNLPWRPGLVLLPALLLIWFALLHSPVSAQENGEGVYEPYQENEFPGWLRDLRRGEIIFFGSLPITILLSDTLFSFGRYAASGFDIDYAPVISGGTAAIISDQERIQRLIAAATGSLILVLVDFVLGQLQEADS